MKKINIFIALLLFAGFAFSQTPQFNNTISIDQTFTNSTEIFPFNNETLYGTGINGNIVFNSDTSLVRLILKDSISGLEYMVYETYPMLDTIWDFSFNEECEETCFLDGFMATSVIVQVRDASIYFDKLLWSGSPMDNAFELQNQAKHNKDLEKIDELNAYIQSKGMIWVAGTTSYSDMSHQDRKDMWGEKYQTFGFEFYKGGIFEIKSPMLDPGDHTYDIVDNFDWRNRHGANNPSSPYYDGDEIGGGWQTELTCVGTLTMKS
ncbi:MAG: hypothetical protein GXO81_11495 [Chlorobi bacterium]|nr:hypothetical protein [Chlorobiota bacterium]